jgi:hypothetical protein
MITREEIIKRLDKLTIDIVELKVVFEEGWKEGVTKNSTRDFLEKFGGWEDTRNPEEIIADIYSARINST